jgi:hypothetical protein
MPNAIDMFRAQREAADAVYARLQEIAGLLAQVRKEVDLVASNADLRAVLQREETWLSQAERTVAEVRIWREREARHFWPSVAQRWVIALLFALSSAWVGAAGYAYVGNRHMDELTALRARADLATRIEDRVATMTPTERRQFDALMKSNRIGEAVRSSGRAPRHP